MYLGKKYYLLLHLVVHQIFLCELLVLFSYACSHGFMLITGDQNEVMKPHTFVQA